MHATRRRFWIELSSAVVSGVLAVLTLATRDWIEVVFNVDPDRHSGSLEWLIVVAAAAIFVVSALLARYEWRRSAGVRTEHI